MRREAELTKAISERFGAGYEIVRKDTDRGNGVVLHGYAIREEGKQIGAVIYVDDFLEYLDNDDMTPEEVARSVKEAYEHNKPDDFSMGELSKSKILGRVVPRLTALAGNEEYLKGLAGRPYLDMAVLYKYPIESKVDGCVTITKELAKMYDITEEELYEAAINNGRTGEGYYIQDMAGMMKEIVSGNGMDTDLPDECFQDTGMMVATSRSKVHGAAAILQSGIIEAAAKICGGSFWILPSSIHEVLIIPGNQADDPNLLREMVREVNDTQLAREDLLSYSVYKYNESTKAIEIA